MAYNHTQTGRWHWLLVIIAVTLVVIGWQVPDEGPLIAFLAAAAFMLFLASLFSHLTVEDDDDRLSIRYGPVPLMGKRIAYDDMRAARALRSSFFEGWGIRYLPGRGWMFNLWGYDCVEITQTNGRILRVGTDDPSGLLEFLQTKL